MFLYAYRLDGARKPNRLSFSFHEYVWVRFVVIFFLSDFSCLFREKPFDPNSHFRPSTTYCIFVQIVLRDTLRSLSLSNRFQRVLRTREPLLNVDDNIVSHIVIIVVVVIVLLTYYNNLAEPDSQKKLTTTWHTITCKISYTRDLSVFYCIFIHSVISYLLAVVYSLCVCMTLNAQPLYTFIVNV